MAHCTNGIGSTTGLNGTVQIPLYCLVALFPNAGQDKFWHISTQGRHWISNLPTSSFMMSLLPLFVSHLPEVEACPEEKRDNSKRQTEDEVYLQRIEMGVRI